MEAEKRKEYLIFTMIFCCVGFVAYGGLAAANRETLDIPWNVILILLIYGLGGSLLLGGTVSGIILFSSFFKHRTLPVKIICCVFFPITLVLICSIGILTFIPYEIYNFIKMKRKTEISQ